jgi:hypothetical protein
MSQESENHEKEKIESPEIQRIYLVKEKTPLKDGNLNESRKETTLLSLKNLNFPQSSFVNSPENHYSPTLVKSVSIKPNEIELTFEQAKKNKWKKSGPRVFSKMVVARKMQQK